MFPVGSQVFFNSRSFLVHSAGHLLSFEAICKCIMRAVIQRVSRASVVDYEQFVQELSVVLGKPVPTGCFGEQMDIAAHNDGPVTLVIDTKERDF